MEKKVIKINYKNLWPDASWERFYKIFLSPLTSNFSFIQSEDPDYLFVGCLGDDFSFINKNSINIQYIDENIHPNFHFYDYVIGFNQNLVFEDRYCFFLPSIITIEPLLEDLVFKVPTKRQAKKILLEKDLFCDFIYNHDRDDKKRKYYFDLITKYKDITNAGRVYNQLLEGNNEYNYIYDYQQKLNIQKRCKFSIIVESFDNSDGLITEKIFHSFLANSIPIYFGEDSIVNIINPCRYINAKHYSDDELLQLIKKIDENDELFISIISKEPLIDPYFFKTNRSALNSFLTNIFSQDYSSARRRPDSKYITKVYNDKFVFSNSLLRNKWIRRAYRIMEKFRLFRK